LSSSSSEHIFQRPAITIQFHHGTIGDTHGGGIRPFIKLNQPQTAIQNVQVKVGVTNNLNIELHIPFGGNRQPAHKELGGQT
jgi:ABC-type thiamine transport system ATPase subunit